MTEEEVLTGIPEKSGSNQKGSLLSEPNAVFLPLPSKSILYQDDPSLQEIKDGNVKVRPMTLRELELFLQPQLIENGTLIDAVFDNCIKSNINPKKLLVSDRTFILIWTRVQSFGSMYRFKFQCKGCKQSISHKIDLAKLPIITLDEIHGERDENGVIKKTSIKKIKEPFSVILPHSKVKVFYTLARGFDESSQSNEQYYKRLKKESLKKRGIEKSGGVRTIRNIDASQEEDDDTYIDEFDQVSIFDSLIKRIISIDGYDNDDIENVLNNMIAGDIVFLQEAILNSDSGIDMNIEVKCPDPDCKFDNRIGIPLTESFFRSSL